MFHLLLVKLLTKKVIAMSKIIALFKRDLKCVFSNVMTIIIVVGLVLLPSIFSWYNVLACWDVFDNTDNLKVAVANSDEGYQSDLVPLEVNLGDQVQNALLEDDEMEWVFTSEDDAIEGAKSGKYYAAVVIPPSFSKDMMTFYSPDVEHASILYYTNEKKNVVAPKLTERGADDVANKINSIFVETIGEVGLNVASSLADYSSETGMVNQLTNLSQNVATLSGRLGQASDVVSSYASLLSSTQSLVSSSADLLKQTGSSADEVIQIASESGSSIQSLSDTMSSSLNALQTSLDASAQGFEGVSDSIDNAYASVDTASSDSASSLENQAVALKNQASAMRDMANSLSACQVPDSAQETLNSFVDQIKASADSADKLADGLSAAAQSIRDQNANSQAMHSELKQLADQATQSISGLSQDYATSIKLQLDSVQSQYSDIASGVLKNANSLQSTSESMSASTNSLLETLDNTQSSLEQSAQSLKDSSQYLATFSDELDAALSSGDWGQLKRILQADPSEMAHSLAAPVSIDRIAMYPAANFGSQMAPLYTMLGLWIGSLLLVVAIKVNASKRAQEEIGYLTLNQLFWGRFLLFSCLSLVQSTILALGNVFFLQVQVTNVLLYMLCYWVSGLVFTFIIYTLVVSFANLGKALSVFLLIIQVTSGGGSYPLPMLPEFVQTISPFMPITHAINAIRAAMMGIYQTDIWIELGTLLAFVIPFMLLGLVLRKPFVKLLQWYFSKAEESKLIN